MELKDGQWYEDRVGAKWTAMDTDPTSVRVDCIRLRDGYVRSFYRNGRYYIGGEDKWDLIKEVDNGLQ